jgi:hypothetical protein
MFDGAIEGAVVAGGTLLFAGLIVGMLVAITRGRSTRDRSGALTMEYGFAYRGLVVYGLLFGLVLIAVGVGIVLGAIEGRDYQWVVIGIGILFTLVFAPMAVEVFTRRVTVSRDGVAGRGLLGATPLISWEDVDEIAFDKVLGCFLVRGEGRVVRVFTLLGGRQEFIHECKGRLDRKTYGKVFKEHGKRLM